MLDKTTSFRAAMFLLLGAFSSHVSPTGRTSMSVRLVIQESCVIHASDPSPIPQPSVHCRHNEPYGTVLVPLDPTQAISPAPGAVRDGKHMIWMVTF
ncbi:hypothetical protein [Paraburkholderia haematera]|uniref:Secreted protein n=1 Tax=Paraburkholderia haematera TaxID=2793077 RepID=A0ABN7N7P5_9BURK|nr:hypothetical protein [Paraburkholderia haematera]CAE6842072.1 hypothetical protein R69888_07012 [Paraburkholderia haematera]